MEEGCERSDREDFDVACGKLDLVQVLRFGLLVPGKKISGSGVVKERHQIDLKVAAGSRAELQAVDE